MARSIFRPVSLTVLAALLASGCMSAHSPRTTGSIASAAEIERSPEEWRQFAAAAARRYDANPDDPAAAFAYGHALRSLGQTAQATAVLEQAAIRHPTDPHILGAYGRALADSGRLEQALEVLDKAHRPDRPDWRILNAQGAILDQLARHQEARSYYETALRMAPGDPGILSNLAMSHVLTKDLARAEDMLRRAASHPRTTPKVRQNLALVLTLRGKTEEAIGVVQQDVGKEQAEALVKGWSARRTG